MTDRLRPERFLPLAPVWFEILLALATGDLHGYAVMQEVVRRSGGAVTLHPGSLYRALARLLEDALIVELDGAPGGGRRRPAPHLPDHPARPRGGASRSRTAPRPAPGRRGARAVRAGGGAEAEPRMTSMPPWVARVLLLAYPRAFRQRFGDDLREGLHAAWTQADGGLADPVSPRPGRRVR